MNSTLLISIYLVTYAVLFSAILVALLLYLRYKHKSYAYGSILLFSIFLFLLAYIILSFDQRQKTSSLSTAKLAYFILDFVGGIVFIYIIPIFIHSVLSIEKTSTAPTISSITFIIFATLFILEVMSNNFSIWCCKEASTQIVNFYAMFLIIVHIRKVKKKVIRSALFVYCLLVLIDIPLVVLYIFIFSKRMPVLRTPNAGPQAILALCAGFFGLFFMAKHFFSTSNSSYQIVMSQFIKDYNITKREAEIIEMIMRGYRNAKIADELFISVKTVKNHLYHIFQKAGVDNRTGLIAEVNKTNGVGVRSIDIY